MKFPLNFKDGCEIRYSEKPEEHSRNLSYQYPSKGHFDSLKLNSLEDFDKMELVSFKIKDSHWRWCFKVDNLEDSEKRCDEDLYEVKIPQEKRRNVKYIEIYYGNGYSLGPTGLCGMRFYDRNDNMIMQAGSEFHNMHKKTILEDNERVVGIIGREDDYKKNFFMDI